MVRVPKTFGIVSGLVVLLALATGWYLVDRQRPVDAGLQRSFDEDMQAATLDLQEQITGDIDERQLAEEKVRAESDLGLQLLGVCNAWVEFHENHPSDETLENRERACGEYRSYLRTGQLPDTDGN